ncbi:cilia- and flagella-associated protein 206-like isoform X1 [Frieseomelitta varia]|uniref:cilia- and flagella-associated protein 206-like isoform X1 n=1 Tax=Frieseomelitta varia TaxID=561572 RepID=UPI001CB6B292|nr:cilia- and flagella-associated protein 206-like isoform X1 [Frieseomelitta varia]
MDNLRRQVIDDIIITCQENNVDVTEDFVSFLLTLFQLNPVYGLKVDDEENNKKIVQAIVEKICDQDKPSLTTLKSQLYFAKHYHDRDETVKRHRLRLHQKTGPIVAEICQTEKLANKQESEKLYQKMLVVITFLSGLGNPTVPSVLREVSVALQSVFQPSELEQYIKMSKREKEEQLMELMCIVAGIRLFNRDCQRGGEGIDDLPAILQRAIEKTRDCIVEFLENLMSRIYKFTALADKIIFIKELIPFDVYTKENVNWAIEMLSASRQQEIYIRKLLSDVEHSEKEIKNYMERLQERLFKLHDTVRYRTAIPTVQVYVRNHIPQFIDLADIWMGLQDEVIVLSRINNFFWELQTLGAKTVNVYNEQLLNEMLSDAEILTDAERLERSMGEIISECGQCTIYHPNETKDFENINLEFLGFCAWKFVNGYGALIPGNPNNGVIKWRGKYYVFCSIATALHFGEDPDRCTYEALDYIRNHFEYVYLFQVYDDIRALQTQEVLSEEGPQLKTCQHQMVQTDLHILPPFIDKNYSSSIWELRNRALHLATISKYKTHSTQTYKSNFRYGIYVQTAPPRNKEVQTRRDNYMNTKKLLTYIFGLRGRRDDNQHVLSFLEDELEHL